MKRFKVIIALVISVISMLIPFTSFACRYYEPHGNDVDAGKITTGTTKIKYSDDRLIYTFTAEKTGFYEVTSVNAYSGFAENPDEFGDYSSMELTGCIDSDDDCCLFSLESGNNYTFIAEIDYGDETKSKEGIITITYIGTLTDFEPRETYVPLNSDGNNIYYYEDENGVCQSVFLTYNLTFSGGKTYTNCQLNAESCAGGAAEIDSSFKAKKGENKVKVNVLGLEKEITLNFFDPADYIDINIFKDGFVPVAINNKINERSDESITFTTPDGSEHYCYEGFEWCLGCRYIIYIDGAEYAEIPAFSDDNSLRDNTKSFGFYLGKGFELMFRELNFKDGAALISNAADAMVKVAFGEIYSKLICTMGPEI